MSAFSGRSGIFSGRRFDPLRSVLAPNTGGGAPAWVPASSLGYRDFVNDRAYKGGLLLANSTTALSWVRASTGYDLAATTLFSANVPRRTSAGLLVEATTTNVIANSNTSSSVAGAQAGSMSYATAAAPNGTTTANRFIEDSTNNFHWVTTQGFAATNGSTYTSSVLYLPTGRTTVGMTNEWSGSWSAVFNLAGSGSVTSQTGCTASIIKLGAFFLLSVAWTAVATSAGFHFGASNSIYQGTGIEVLQYWGMQQELGSSATSRIITGASATTRSADAGSDTVPTGATQCILTYSDASTSTSTGLTGGGTFNIPNTPAGKTLVSMDYRA